MTLMFETVVSHIHCKFPCRYTIDLAKLTPNLRELVKVLSYDESAQAFLSGAYAIPYAR